MFELERNIAVDFLGITLEDLVTFLKNENFFRKSFWYENGQGFYVEKLVNANEVVFQVRRNRLFGKQVQTFNYSPSEKRLTIKSKYKLFPGFYILLIGMLSMSLQLYVDYANWIKISITALLMIFLGIIFGRLNLQFDAKAIERELMIRLKHLLRQKGFYAPL